MKLYIAGPMRGIPYFNFDAFDEATRRLRARGYKVISPADMDRLAGFDPKDMPPDSDWDVIPSSFNMEAARSRDVSAILYTAEGICCLPGWWDSTGAIAEVALGTWRQLPVHDLDTWLLADAVDADAVDADDARQCQKTTVSSGNGSGGGGGEGGGGEVRVTDPTTGGQKGQKKARFDLIPAKPLWDLAEHFGAGALKYADRNWERGYKWSLSYAALQRHLNRFWRGEDVDPETGSKHIIAAAWHCLALAEFMDAHPAMDDRPTVSKGGA